MRIQSFCMAVRQKLWLFSTTTFFFFFTFICFDISYYDNEMNEVLMKFVFENFNGAYSFHYHNPEAAYASSSWMHVSEEDTILHYLDSRKIIIKRALLGGGPDAPRVVSMGKVGADKTHHCPLRLLKRHTFKGKEICLKLKNNKVLKFKTLYDLPNDFSSSVNSQIVVTPPACMPVGMYGFYYSLRRIFVSVESKSKAIFYYSFHNGPLLPEFSFGLKSLVIGKKPVTSSAAKIKQFYVDAFIEKKKRPFLFKNIKKTSVFRMVDSTHVRVDTSGGQQFMSLEGTSPLTPTVFAIESLDYDRFQQKVTVKFQTTILSTAEISPVTEDEFEGYCFQKKVKFVCGNVKLTEGNKYVSKFSGAQRNFDLLHLGNEYYIFMSQSLSLAPPPVPLPPVPIPKPTTRILSRNDISQDTLVVAICGLFVSFSLIYLVGRRRRLARKRAPRRGNNWKFSRRLKIPKIKA